MVLRGSGRGLILPSAPSGSLSRGFTSGISCCSLCGGVSSVFGVSDFFSVIGGVSAGLGGTSPPSGGLGVSAGLGGTSPPVPSLLFCGG